MFNHKKRAFQWRFSFRISKKRRQKIYWKKVSEGRSSICNPCGTRKRLYAIGTKSVTQRHLAANKNTLRQPTHRKDDNTSSCDYFLICLFLFCLLLYEYHALKENGNLDPAMLFSSAFFLHVLFFCVPPSEETRLGEKSRMGRKKFCYPLVETFILNILNAPCQHLHFFLGSQRKKKVL